MRDLKANLKELTDRGNYKTDYPTQLEWLERAIAAESKNTESYDLLYGVFDKVKDEAEQLKQDKAALTEENARLTAQVAGLREGLTLLKHHFDTNNIVKGEVRKEWAEYCNKLLSSPDPGEKYRARIEKMQAALDEIAHPIKYLQAEADEKGTALNGYFAAELSNNAKYLKRIAELALIALEGDA